MLHLHNRLPVKLSWIAKTLEARVARTMRDNVKPVILLHSLCSLILVHSKRDLPSLCATLYFNEPNIECSLRVFWMRSARNKIEPAIVGFHALYNPTFRLFVLDSELDGNALDLWIADHRRDLWRKSFRMQQHRG